MSFDLLCIWKGVRPSYFKRALMLRPYLTGTLTQLWLHDLHLIKQHRSISIHLHHYTWLSTRFTMTFHALPHGKKRKSNGHSAHIRQVYCLSTTCTLCNPPRGRGTSCVFCYITCLGLHLLRTSCAPTGNCNIPRNTHLSKKHVSNVVCCRTMLSGPSAWRRLPAWPVPHASGHCLLPY
jgi:hypothetical protein